MNKNVSPGTDAPRLSIVIATHQAAATLGKCLQSVVDQEFPDWEVLVADGLSTDATVDIIRRFERHISWWCSEKDSGIYDAWNRALAHARGEYVCFIGADDAWANPGALANLFAAIGEGTYDLVSSRGKFIDSTTGRSLVFGSAWDFDHIGPRMIVCHPGLLHRRALFSAYGEFDTRYSIAGDLDFLMRLPRDLRSLHVDATSIIVEMAGVSRQNVLTRLREQRLVLSGTERYGPVRAYINWFGKLLRWPVARLLGISH